MTGCSFARHKGPKSDHFDGVRFFNPHINNQEGFIQFMRWKFSGSPKKWPKKVEIADFNWEPLPPGDLRERITFINHATVLLELEGVKIITDPVFSERASPVTWAGPRRIKRAGLELEKLPKIDLVLVSHNHYDHLDVESLRRLHEKDQPLILAPLGDCKIISKIKGVRCQEMDWWQSLQISDEVKVTFCPSQHWSARGLFDRNKSLWGSFVLEVNMKKIYFAGDTGFGDHFQKVSEKFGEFDLALLPIGAYIPRWFMEANHMNPEDAVKAHKVLKSKRSLGIHWGTFQLTDEFYLEPIQDLEKAREKYQVSEKEFFALENGEWVWLE